MSRTLPHDPEGYAVEVDTRTVHSRHAVHARGFPRTRRIAGVYAYLDGFEPIPCEDCYPAPEPERKPERKRRAPAPRPGMVWLEEPYPRWVAQEDIDDGPFIAERVAELMADATAAMESNVEPVAFEDIPVEGEVGS